jgi:putative endonuclease
MYFKQRVGLAGENIACGYLQINNYKIINRNFKCNQGEIDIIAFDIEKNELVFFEVKTRTNSKYGLPVEAVGEVKQTHMVKAIKYYLYKNNIYKIPIRIDVIEVCINKTKYQLNHIKRIETKEQ